tara:strand:- start:2222 stop:3106 length:885 start_codon:yes stop_codon:yes gene_type:complete
MPESPDYLRRWQDRVDGTLRSLLEAGAANPEFRGAMHYCVFNGGKRIRPALVYLSAAACDVDPSKADLPAAAIELIHAYSLVHDDLPAMDDDDLRRGKPTCHKQYDEATAILAGDALLTLAFETLADLPARGVDARTALGLVAAISQAAGAAGMVHGQVLDLAAGTQQLDHSELVTLHAAKTGALITVSTVAGPMLAGADPKEAACFRRYGQAIGLAFQIQDDILDVTGDPAVTGKPSSDQRNEKATFVSIHGLDGARSRLDDTLGAAHDALTPLDNRAADLHALADFIASRQW